MDEQLPSGWMPEGAGGDEDALPRYRSGAVARMLRMPVATLRIWERRYRVAAPATSPSGHRLYSAADVKRLSLLRQLTALGHAIGSLAALDLPALRQVAATHAGVLAAPRRAGLSLEATGVAPSPAAPGAGAQGQAPLGASAAALPRDGAGAGQGAAEGEGAGEAEGEGARPARRGARQTPVAGPAPAVPAAAGGRLPAAPAVRPGPVPAAGPGALGAAAPAVAAGREAGVEGDPALAARPGARVAAQAGVADAPAPAPWRVLVVGAALARRLEQPTLQARLSRAAAPVQVWDKLELAVAAVEAASVAPAEAVLMQCATLRAQDLPRLRALARAAGAQRVHVLYGFATSALALAFEAAGIALLRAPQDDRALGRWLQASCAPLALPVALGPRRWDDEALADFAALSTTISCECPRHVAELLMQLSSFESYSAECAHRDPADAALHSYLGQVAGTARALFESALERLAVQEGLTLPGPGE
jgi:hypothetical protein